jgi:hypothetical protein
MVLTSTTKITIISPPAIHNTRVYHIATHPTFRLPVVSPVPCLRKFRSCGCAAVPCRGIDISRVLRRTTRHPLAHGQRERSISVGTTFRLHTNQCMQAAQPERPINLLSSGFQIVRCVLARPYGWPEGHSVLAFVTLRGEDGVQEGRSTLSSTFSLRVPRCPAFTPTCGEVVR